MAARAIWPARGGAETVEAGTAIISLPQHHAIVIIALLPSWPRYTNRVQPRNIAVWAEWVGNRLTEEATSINPATGVHPEGTVERLTIVLRHVVKSCMRVCLSRRQGWHY